MSNKDQKQQTPPGCEASAFNALLSGLRWPKGRYNNRKIDGVKLSFALHILQWKWKPIYDWCFGMPVFIWLCFTIRAEASYVPNR